MSSLPTSPPRPKSKEYKTVPSLLGVSPDNYKTIPQLLETDVDATAVANPELKKQLEVMFNAGTLDCIP